MMLARLPQTEGFTRCFLAQKEDRNDRTGIPDTPLRTLHERVVAVEIRLASDHGDRLIVPEIRVPREVLAVRRLEYLEKRKGVVVVPNPAEAPGLPRGWIEARLQDDFPVLVHESSLDAEVLALHRFNSHRDPLMTSLVS